MILAEVGSFLVSAPLYRDVVVEDVSLLPLTMRSSLPAMGSPPTVEKYGIELPALVDRDCPKCGPTKWRKATEHPHPEGLVTLWFGCQNCREERFAVWLVVTILGKDRVRLTKAGQYPRLEVTLPRAFQEALGDRVSLYRKGMTSRHSGYGIGALTYFRRLIEDTTDEMLDFLEQALVAADEAHPALQHLQNTRAGRAFEDKVKLAAEVLPPHLRPGGANPFGDLYDLLSIGLHGLSDEECCDVVDGMDESLKFIYTRLKTHAQEERTYKDAVQKIHEKVSKLKKG